MKQGLGVGLKSRVQVEGFSGTGQGRAIFSPIEKRKDYCMNQSAKRLGDKA